VKNFPKTVRKQYFHAQKEQGFTLSEIVVAIMIVTMLASAITGVVIGSMGLLTRLQINASDNARTQTVLNNIVNQLKEAERITTATNTSLTYDYLRDTRCERHTYTFETDPANAGRLRLAHTIRALDVPSDASCASVADTINTNGLLTAAVEPLTNAPAELVNLSSTSGFTYANGEGDTLTFPITASACPAAPNYLNISVTTVKIDTFTNNDPPTMDTNVASAATRANILGVMCK